VKNNHKNADLTKPWGDRWGGKKKYLKDDRKKTHKLERPKKAVKNSSFGLENNWGTKKMKRTAFRAKEKRGGGRPPKRKTAQPRP